MKKVLVFLVILTTWIYGFANSSFDKTINYQFNNAKAYEGETLYLFPITNSMYENTVGPYYPWFMDYSFDDATTSENSTHHHYKYVAGSTYDGKLTGTHKRHIEGHAFYVNKVNRYHDFGDTWVFYLTDLNTGDNLKFIYHGYTRLYIGSFAEFPFIVEKHVKYLKSLIGTNLVFSTKRYGVMMHEMAPYYYPIFETDIKTNEKIKYTNIYEKWKITGITFDEYNTCICFIVSNGKYTTKVPYDIQYSVKNPNYNIGNRVFPEKQWNMLINKYGEDHMKLIMNTDFSDDMTIEEKYMAGGRRFGKFNQKKTSSTCDDLKNAGTILFNSTKDSVKDQFELINYFISLIVNLFCSIFCI